MIPESIISEIKYRNDIETAVSSYVNLKRRGKNLVGLCPFHSEKTPSFTVYPENGSFYCFGCGVGGDVFTFTGLIENLDYIEAVKLLAERSGVALPQDGYDDSMQRLKNKIYDINRDTARFFHSFLMSPEGKWALDYLLGRGLTLKTIKHFGLGAAPDSWDMLIKHLKEKGYSQEDMLAAGVVGKSSRGTLYDRFRKRVMFPIINIRGNIIAFSGRAMPGEDKQGGKYVNTSDTPVYKKSSNLFGMNFAKNVCSERVILVEGNMDVISLHQAGFTNAVAPLGTAFTMEQANLLTRYTKEIVLTLDADAAGQKAIKRASELLENTGLKTRVVVIPDGKDPDEFIKKNGPDRFQALLDGAVSDIEYKLLTAAKDINLESEDGRLRYLSAAAEIVAGSDDVMTRDIYIGRLSERYGVSRTALNTKVEEIRKKNIRISKKKEISDIIRPKFTRDDINPERRRSPKAAAAEETLIAVLLKNPDFYKYAKEQLPPEKLITSLNRRIYEIILSSLEKGGSLDISVFAERLLPAEIGYLVSLQNSEKAGKNPEIVLKDCIRVILEEDMLLTAQNRENTSVEDWAEALQTIIDKKSKGKK
ncbi:MAG: DNA primase [Acutalibacteraceae bacterium]|nr:DNA primase [Acutalibacteraceae bacterium]